MTEFNHISVDIETTGTDSGCNAIIQIGAVRFDPHTLEVDHNVFNRCLAIPKDRYWDEDTRDWWFQQEPHILQGIFARMEDPARVMIDFVKWVGADLKTPPILVAKPVSFEHPFFESYCRKFELPMPWRYWEAVDLRSFCQGRGMRYLDQEIPFNGDAHDALDDAFHQASVLLECIHRTGAYVS
jgi:DNA polymerase III epsilon subunit-like protein